MSMELFCADNAGDTLLVNYPLHKDSVVFELGGYTGGWSEKICDKYACNLFVFEPVNYLYKMLLSKFKGKNNVRVFNYGILGRNDKLNITMSNDGSSFYSSGESVQEADVKKIDDVLSFLSIQHVDLIQINIEGSEYALLDYMIDADLVSLFRYIQIQFHKNVPDAEIRRDRIVRGLEKTHARIFNYEFIFESWKIK